MERKDLLCHRVTGTFPQTSWAMWSEELRRELAEAVADGYTRFLSGFAEGADLLFAALVVEEKARHPELFLEAALPYAGRLRKRRTSGSTSCSGTAMGSRWRARPIRAVLLYASATATW